MEMLQLTALFIFGIISSIEDIKYGKVSNRLILIFCIFGFVLSMSVLTNLQQVLIFILSSLLTLIVGFALWFFNLWGAGDAKLLFAYSLIYPLSFYEVVYLVHFPFISIILNSLIISLIYFVIILLFRTSLKNKKTSIKNSLNKQSFFQSFVSFFGISAFFSFLLSGSGISQTMSFLIIVLTYLVLESFLKKNFFRASVLLAVVVLAMNLRAILDLEFWLKFSHRFLLFFFLIKFFPELSRTTFRRKVSINDLREGMLVEEAIVEKEDRYLKTTGNKLLFFKGYKVVYPGLIPLTEVDILHINKLRSQNKLKFDVVTVREKFFFAPLVFIAVVITLLNGGHIILESAWLSSVSSLLKERLIVYLLS